MALFNEAAGPKGYAEPANAPTPQREMSHNERLMNLTQRMAEKDEQISHLQSVIESMANFIGYK